jgi:hypothetical protein
MTRAEIETLLGIVGYLLRWRPGDFQDGYLISVRDDLEEMLALGLVLDACPPASLEGEIQFVYDPESGGRPWL